MPARESQYQHLRKTAMPWQKLGPKQYAILGLFVPSAAIFGAAAAVFGVYLTDWRVICDYIPLYNTKYPKEE